MTTLVSLTYEYEETTGKFLKLTFSGASERVGEGIRGRI
jgi:hypothetical protein